MGLGSQPAQLALDIAERAAGDALTQRLRLLRTCIVVLAGLLPRMTFDAIQAYANIAVTKNTAADCGVCDSCQSSTWCEPQSSQSAAKLLRSLICHRLMNEWILSSPQFQFLVVMFSTPFALTVAQFGMLSSRDLQLLRASFGRKKQAVIVHGQQGKAADAGDVTRGAAVIRYVCNRALDLFLAMSLLSIYI